MFSSTSQRKVLLSLLLIKNLTCTCTSQSVSLVTKAKKKKKICLNANYQYRLYSMNPPVKSANRLHIYTEVFALFKKSTGVMPLSNELVKINEEVNIKWYLQSCKYTSLRQNTVKKNISEKTFQIHTHTHTHICKYVHLQIYTLCCIWSGLRQIYIPVLKCME